MLITFIFFLLSYDSLPPLPDLSKITYPEPELWIEPVDNYLILQGYTKDFYGGKFVIQLGRLYVSTQYEQKNEWDSTKFGSIRTDYSIPLPHLWLKPAINGYFVKRNDEYRLLIPSLNFSSTVPWMIVFGEFKYDLWQINQRNYAEQEGKIDIIFDQTDYMPHFEIAEFYTDNQLKPEVKTKLHIRNFHVSFGTPILHGFFSPGLEIQYLDPKIKIETKFKSGSVYKTLNQYFNPETPIKYGTSVPEESLRIGFGFDFKLELFKHFFNFSGCYNNWYARLITGNNYELTKVHDVQEANLSLFLKNNFEYRFLNLKNSFSTQYNWSDTSIPFLAKYDIRDTISIDFGAVEIASDLHYLRKRSGINKKLPGIAVLSPFFGLKYRFLKLFLIFYNITNEKAEIFDDYHISDRQYALGLEINYKF